MEPGMIGSWGAVVVIVVLVSIIVREVSKP